MVAGRPRKPTQLHILDGTFKPCRHGGDGEPVADGEPERPRFLRGEALAFWKEVVPGLVEMKVAKAADAPALAQMCQWWAACRRFQKMLNRARDTDKNLFRITAALAMASDKFNSYAGRFGLTPSDRTRLRIGGVEKPKQGLATRERKAL